MQKRGNLLCAAAVFAKRMCEKLPNGPFAAVTIWLLGVQVSIRLIVWCLGRFLLYGARHHSIPHEVVGKQKK